MKTVKIEDAIKAWREHGTKCRPNIDSSTFQSPFYWNWYFMSDSDFILEPKTRKETRSLWVNIYPNVHRDFACRTKENAEECAANSCIECREIKYDVEIPEE